MMQKFIHHCLLSLTLAFLVFAGSMNYAQINLEYKLSMTEPYTHYFEVEIKVTGLKKEYIDLLMPVWAPGSYLVRDFSKNVEFFNASDASGNKLKFEKINKYTWRVYTNNKMEVNISYKVYAFEASVRTSFLDESHGYLNGTSVFMYIKNMKNLPSTLKIIPYKDWKTVSTALDPVTGEIFTYSSPDYDILADSPIEIGNQEVINFNAAGVDYSVAMYGSGNFNADTLKKYMSKIIEAETKVVGENPNKHYLFIVHNLANGSGGLEHLNSTTLEVNRWIYNPKSSLNRFLSLVAHEHFHLWNVKRIRPIALGPFNYQSENYTTLLWEMEGVTSYYSNVILRRTDIITPENFLDNISAGISYVENQPGSKVQSASEASFDAWIKAYQPNENSYNTTISYYSKGAIIGMLLDLEIMNATNGEKNYDNVLKYLYNDYYKNLKRGFTKKEYQQIVEKVAGKQLNDFFRDYVYSTDSIDYNKYFNYAGLKLIDKGNKDDYFGIRTDKNEVVRSVVEGTSAYSGGINANDEILAINNYRVDSDNFDKIFSQYNIGDTIKVTISRDGILQDLIIPLKGYHRYKYKLIEIDNPTDKQKMIYNKWLDIKQ